jgi:threonine dehydrogenase-like Zn-dependent dehydrogenase
VGILAAQCAFVRGAERVVLIDQEQDRLDFALARIPKLETLNFAQKKVRGAQRRCCKCRGCSRYPGRLGLG